MSSESQQQETSTTEEQHQEETAMGGPSTSPNENLSDSQQWPSLASPIPSDTSWEIVSPTPLQQQNTLPPLADDDFDDLVVVLPPMPKQPALLLRRRSSSTPDFISLERKMSIAEEDDAFLQDLPGDNNNTHPPNKVGWGGAVSFRDMVLSQVTELASEVAPVVPTVTPMKSRPKPKFVVTPTIRRCVQSTPNLQALEDQVLGETDAMDYYHRKQKGMSGRQNGMKIRPDEAKRLDITMLKKEMQRQNQGMKG
jgi:hypothetical protein